MSETQQLEPGTHLDKEIKNSKESQGQSHSTLIKNVASSPAHEGHVLQELQQKKKRFIYFFHIYL